MKITVEETKQEIFTNYCIEDYKHTDTNLTVSLWIRDNEIAIYPTQMVEPHSLIQYEGGGGGGGGGSFRYSPGTLAWGPMRLLGSVIRITS